MSQFPTIFPTFTDFDGNQTLAQNNHAARHNKVHEEFTALATKVGINGSTDPNSLDKKTADLRSEVDALTPAYEGYTDQSIEDNVTIGVDSTTGFTDFNASQFYSSGGMFTIRGSATANAAANKPATTTEAGWLETKMLTGSAPGVSAWAYVTQTYTTIGGKVYTRMVNSSATPTPVSFGAWKSTVDMDSVYPIGSYYINETNGTNPGTLLGFGTWSQVKDTFILAVGDTYAANTTGGEATHILTPSETATKDHTHNIGANNTGGYVPNGLTPNSFIYGSFGNGAQLNGYPTDRAVTNILASGMVQGVAGGASNGTAHNNMPPYKTAYVWKRTA